jgi:hypothetical protein
VNRIRGLKEFLNTTISYSSGKRVEGPDEKAIAVAATRASVSPAMPRSSAPVGCQN